MADRRTINNHVATICNASSSLYYGGVQAPVVIMLHCAFSPTSLAGSWKLVNFSEALWVSLINGAHDGMNSKVALSELPSEKMILDTGSVLRKFLHYGSDNDLLNACKNDGVVLCGLRCI